MYEHDLIKSVQIIQDEGGRTVEGRVSLRDAERDSGAYYGFFPYERAVNILELFPKESHVLQVISGDLTNVGALVELATPHEFVQIDFGLPCLKAAVLQQKDTSIPVPPQVITVSALHKQTVQPDSINQALTSVVKALTNEGNSDSQAAVKPLFVQYLVGDSEPLSRN